MKHQAQRNRGALQHAAGQLVGIQVVHTRGKIDNVEKLLHMPADFLSACTGLVRQVNILKLTADLVYGAEAVHGFLKDHRNFFPAEPVQLPDAHGQQLLTLIAHRARDIGHAGVQHSQHRHAQGGFARAALAHNAQRIPLVHAQRHMVHGLYQLAA